LSSISDSAVACLSVLLGDRVPALPTPKPPQKRSSSLRYTHTHTHTLNGPFSGTIRVSRYQKGKTSNLDFTEARESEWQWHQLGHMQVCASLQTDNHASTSLLSFLQASCRPTNSIRALNSSTVRYMWVKSYSRNKVVQRLRLRIN